MRSAATLISHRVFWQISQLLISSKVKGKLWDHLKLWGPLTFTDVLKTPTTHQMKRQLWKSCIAGNVGFRIFYTTHIKHYKDVQPPSTSGWIVLHQHAGAWRMNPATVSPPAPPQLWHLWFWGNIFPKTDGPTWMEHDVQFPLGEILQWPRKFSFGATIRSAF